MDAERIRILPIALRTLGFATVSTGTVCTATVMLETADDATILQVTGELERVPVHPQVSVTMTLGAP